MAFATKPELAMAMLPGRWTPVSGPGGRPGDEVYGQYGGLRALLEARNTAYVLAVPVNQRVHAPSGATEVRVDVLAASTATAGMETDLGGARRQRPPAL